MADQTLQIAGHGALKSLVHAPNPSVTFNVNNDMIVSVVTNYGPHTSKGLSRWREFSTAFDQSADTDYF